MLLTGNSAVFGYMLPSDETVAGLLNDRFRRTAVSAHVFNLAFFTTYQVKDAVIIHQALAYAPDVIIHAVTLADFAHQAPLPFPVDAEFFRQNSLEVQRLAAERPPGLTQPLEVYELQQLPTSAQLWWMHFGEVGALVRAEVRELARAARMIMGPAETTSAAGPGTISLAYDCDETKAAAARDFQDWEQWNILAYLEHIRAATGVQVVLVNWPMAKQPVSDCYNVRYPTALVEQYEGRLRQQAERRRLPYVDLGDVIPPEEFRDSLHLTVNGQHIVAEWLAPLLEQEIAAVLQRKRGSHAEPAGSLSSLEVPSDPTGSGP